MKLSTKFILVSSVAFVLFAGVFGVFIYGTATSVVAEDLIVRMKTVWNISEPLVQQGDMKQVQKNFDALKERESDLSKFDLYKLENSPVIITSLDSTLVGKAGDADAVEAINKTENGPVVALVDNSFDIYLRLPASGDKGIYVANAQFSLQSLNVMLKELFLNVGIVSAVFLGIVMLVLWFMVNRILKRPLARMIEAANKIAAGDLIIQLGKELKSKDEVGQLSRAFHEMSENLKHLIGKIGDSAQQVAASAEQLTAGAEQTSQASEHIVETVQQVAIGSEKQVSSVEESAQVINEMAVGVQKISESAQNVSETALQASDVATEGNQAIHTVMRQMNSINNTVHDLHEMIKRLGERSQEIGQIVQVITGIAEQTNLLALNAAIEAARAGENGRGFSVVADEVRKLAVQSASSGQQITQLVETIQAETHVAILSMETGTKEVAEGITVVNTAGESFRRIQYSINDVVEQIHSVSAAVKQMSAGAERVVESIQVIAEVAEETAGSTQMVSASTEEQLASMNEIADASIALNGMAEELQELVTKFRT